MRIIVEPFTYIEGWFDSQKLMILPEKEWQSNMILDRDGATKKRVNHVS